MLAVSMDTSTSHEPYSLVWHLRSPTPIKFLEAETMSCLIWSPQNLEVPEIWWVLSTCWPNGQAIPFLHLQGGITVPPCQITGLRGELREKSWVSDL